MDGTLAMSSPIGHCLTAFTALEAARASLPAGSPGRAAVAASRWPWVFAAAALAADLDTPLSAVLGDGARRVLALGAADGVHHGLTHTLVFAVAAGGLVWAVARRGVAAAPRRLALALILACTLHPVLDWAVGNGVGIPFAWPLTARRFYCPWRIVPSAPFALSVSGYLDDLTSLPSLRNFLLEVGIFLPLYAAARRVREAGDGLVRLARGGLAVETVVLVLLTGATLYMAHHLWACPAGFLP